MSVVFPFDIHEGSNIPSKQLLLIIIPSSPALLLFLVVEDTLFPRKLVEDRILPC